MAEAILIECGTPSHDMMSLFQRYDQQQSLAAAKAVQEFSIIVPQRKHSAYDEDGLLLMESSYYCFECSSATNVLLESVSNDHTECLRHVLNLRPDIDLHSPQLSNGVALPHVAARKGSIATLKILLEWDPSLALIKDYKGTTPLHVSAYHNRLDSVKYLLYNSDSSANAKDSDGATPVHFAAASGNLECLKELCETGKGDINATTNSGETPAYFAAQEGHLSCLQWLVDRLNANLAVSSYDGMAPIHAAAQNGHLQVVHWLVKQANCPINLRTSDGATPVHFAAAKGHVLILEWMLHQKLVSGLERDDYGATPVHDAAEHGQLECLHTFYNHSVKLDVQDADGFRPKDMALDKGHIECATFIAHPRQHLHNWIQQKRQLQGAWYSPMESGTKYKELDGRKKSIKKRLSFSFFSKMKVGSK